MELKNDAKGEQFSHLYQEPQIPFLTKPERQKDFRREFIQEVGRMPEPKPLYLLADKMRFDELDSLGDRSAPPTTREELTKYFKRRSAYMQH